VPKARRSGLAATVLVAAAGVALPGFGRAAGQPGEVKPKPAEPAKVELFRLTNEELLKQADAIYQTASRDYLAQQRAVTTVELLLEEVRAQAGRVPEPPPADSKVAAQPATERGAKKAVEAAKAKQEAVRRQRQLVQAQKDLLDRLAVWLEACRSAAVAFQNALDDLKAYALESSLRVKDGSLAEAKVHAMLKADLLEKKKRELGEELTRLKTKSADVQRGQEAVARLLDQAAKAVLASDAVLVEESRNLAREQQRHELEKAHANKKPDQMIVELARLVDDGIGLKGTYQLALRKFDARAREAAALRKMLDALKPPDVKVPELTRAEDVATAAQALQKLMSFHAARKKSIEGLRTVVAALAREGGDFEADAAVSEEHLFKMQILAQLLRKQGVPDDKLPEKARAAELDPAAARQKQSASAVRAATEKAKAETVLLDKQLAEAGAAADASAKQLNNLKSSQEVTLAALDWQGRLKAMTGAQVVTAFTAAHKEFGDRQARLKAEAEAYAKAVAAATEARARLDGVNDPFLRAAEEQGQAARHKLLAELRKEAGVERATGTAATPVPAAEPKKTEPAKKAAPDTRPELERVSDRLSAFQQLLAGRVRVLDEREAKKKELLSAQEALAKEAAVYAKTLADSRLLALRMNAAAVDLKTRLGKGGLPADAIPEGLTEALRLELRTKLDASATAVLNTLNQVQQERDSLLRPDPDGEALTKATKELLTAVGRRLDLLADLKQLAADYRKEKAARTPTEQKRLEQRAAERQAGESSGWDALLGFDSSQGARSLAELLESYYRELIEIEDKEDNLAKERAKVETLLELTRQETAALARVLPLLARQATQLEAAREEDTVLAHARLRPERADEQLKAYQTKTGRLLSKPPPLADKEKAERVDELAKRLFERYVALEAAKNWADVLSARAAPTGVKAEAGAYQDELATLSAASAANTRRVHALTGRDEPGPATDGEIGQTRDELSRVRTQGVQRMAVKIAVIVLAALLIPRLLMWVLRRAGGESSSLVLTALRALVKAAIWVGAFTLILSILGFDVTAILAGLGIGGLAIGLAAQPMIADLIAAVVIFAERRFKIGDVIRLGSDDPAQVVGLTWRSTQVRNSDGLVINIPNRKVTEAMIQNLTRGGATYDSLNVSVTTDQDVGKVLTAIQGALTECAALAAGHDVSVREFNQKGQTKTIKYRFAWFLPDYEARNRTRDEVFARIGASLAHEDLAGTEISLA
jgi:small-conductance mechanosensitive channel